MTADPRDLPDTAELRRRGSLKWTAMPDVDIAAWVAESDLGIAPAITAAVCDAVGAGLLGYLPPAVRRQLGEACARWQLDRYGWQVDPARVHPVGDVREALRITIDQFSRPGSPVILPTPAYMPFVTAPGVWGREVIQVPMLTGSAAGGRAALDLDGIDRAFRAGGHLLVLVNPHNPTGRVLERDELLAVADIVERNGGRVFSDEIHAPLVHPGAHHIPYASLSGVTASHTVTATSASKAWNIPGLKCAQVVLSNAADAAAWARTDILLTEGASTIGAVANSAAYTEAGPWLTEALGYLDGNRHALRQALDERAPLVGYRAPEGTYLAWLDLRAALDARSGASHADDAPEWARADPGDLERWIRRQTGVAVTDGAWCGEAGRGFVRLNLAMPRSMVVEAARRIAGVPRRVNPCIIGSAGRDRSPRLPGGPMRTVPPGRRRLRAHQASVAALAAAVLLIGLTACDAGGSPELDHLQEQMEQGVDDARASAEGVQQEIEGAGLDEATRAAVEDAVGSATDAIGRARTAIEDEADAAGPAADQAVAEARAGLAEARAKVSDAAATTEGAVRRALDSLGEQIDRLSAQIDRA